MVMISLIIREHGSLPPESNSEPRKSSPSRDQIHAAKKRRIALDREVLLPCHSILLIFMIIISID